MYYNFILLFILFLSYICFVKSVRINAIVFEHSETGIYSDLTRDFNDYSIKNGLNITLDLTLFTSKNSTVLTEKGDKLTIQSLLATKSKKYDIYLYDITYVYQYGEDLMDLKDYISPDILKLYYSEVFNNTCYDKGRLVGIPLKLSFSVLYSNENLLKTYNCTVPETWDDFLDTLKIIRKGERESNNNISGYNGLFGDTDSGTNTIYEMLYSYRKSVESSYPDMTSQEAANALEMLKKIYTELSSNDDFYEGDGYIVGKYFSGNELFLKYWYITGEIRYKNQQSEYSNFSKKVRSYIFEYLFGDKSVSEVLTKVNDLTKIYTISLNTEDSSYGLITFIVLITLSVLVVITFLLINMERFKPFFTFLPNSYWHFILLGILCHISSSYTDYDEVLSYKYHIKIFLYCIGFTFIFVPLLFKLIVNFPEKNDKSKWISEHKYLFILIFLLIDVVLNLINIGSTYNIKTKIPGNGKMYNEYKITGTFSKFMIILFVAIKSLIILTILFLIFIEWNIEETLYDLRFSVSAIYIDLISIIMMITMEYIKLNNYLTYKLIGQIFFIIFNLSNYIFFICIRLIFSFFKEKESESKYINKHKITCNNNINNNSSITRTTRSSISNQSSPTKSYSKLISYHYRTCITDSNIKNCSSSNCTVTNNNLTGTLS
ncbi:hypothetical protein BCR32DRAFT_266407 [Anaeromyces robustus]|uniref:G-protein coupled receptors family 3 profile domain-containing protein n=1 Tax=Anaeromyces robustus TaxID=1754192 RepID=A0A1Y1XET0_9FUNG|nr:hypothetical protein BCR32DRAFT_266407 [Anaeromyces robustus]|eukprot:ORX84270.1 hypothetical protein BCR32DRAFT_266407 [Anaeromyces robustus]